MRSKDRFGNRLAEVLSDRNARSTRASVSMPSKKQRAKKPGSKVAQKKVAEESRRGVVWAQHEDDAAQWLQKQLQQQEVDVRGRRYPGSRDASSAGGRAVPQVREEAKREGGSKQHAVVGTAKVGTDQMHHATKGVMEVHMPDCRGDEHDVINMLKPPFEDSQKAVEMRPKDARRIQGPDMGTIAIEGLLQEHGLTTVPPEWNSAMGRLLLKEVLQTRVNKLKKAKQQRDKRRENRKQQ